jgi:5-methylcytosine-specific restriction protein A
VRRHSSRWEALRQQVLRADWYCVACAAAGRVSYATEVDHIVPRTRGGADALENLQGLCRACHARKTGREGRRAQGA